MVPVREIWLRSKPEAEAERAGAGWRVPSAYVGVACKEDEATDEDGGPLWTVPIECNGGYAQVADVCGGSKAEAIARAQAVCRALQGTDADVDAEVVNHIERLFRSDNEDDWLAAEALQHHALRTPTPSAVERENERLRKALVDLAALAR
jgi:hypothetical protein